VNSDQFYISRTGHFFISNINLNLLSFRIYKKKIKKEMAYRIILRRDTEANWNTNNPVLSSGELGYSTDTFTLKIGDGQSAWTSLDPIAVGPSYSVVSTDYPGSTGATGVEGQLATDGTNLYVCIATNSWRRTALSSF